VGVQGMVCAFCAKGLEKSFSEKSEVSTVHVDLDKKLITLETKPEQTLSDAAIKDIITHAGFNVASTHREK
jgi:copper chaperone CopZ